MTAEKAGVKRLFDSDSSTPGARAGLRYPYAKSQESERASYARKLAVRSALSPQPGCSARNANSKAGGSLKRPSPPTATSRQILCRCWMCRIVSDRWRTKRRYN